MNSFKLRGMTRAVVGAAAFATAAISTPVHAQPIPDRDFALEIFEPLPAQGINLLNIGVSEVLGHLRPSVGLTVHFQDDPFILVDANDPDKVEQRVVDYVLKGEISAAVGLFDFLDIGLVMPVILSQQAGELLTEAAEPQSFTSFTTGDLRLVPKIRLVDNEDAGGFGLAVAVPVHLPTGDETSYQSEGRVRVEGRLIIDYRHESGFVVAGNVGYMPRARRQVLNFQNTDALRFGLGLNIPVAGEVLGLFGIFHGSVGINPKEVDGFDDPSTEALEALGGLTFRFNDNWAANVGAGGGVTGGVGSPDVRVVASVAYTPARHKRDSDLDGIYDDVDQCPDVPEDKDGFEDEDGCPDLDNDKDGIPDLTDGVVDSSGFGACRNDAEDKDGFEDEDGCPDTDNDQDGVPDLQDGMKDGTGYGACRNQAEDRDGFEDSDGCPDPDNDQDGIEDAVDGKPDDTGFGVCRDLPETKNEWEDEDGCPDEKPRAVLKETGIAVLEKIYFDFDKATLQERSFPVLDAVIAILKENPQLTLVRVEGHTDTVGTRRYNLDLSMRRARTVVGYLVKHGIEKKRIFPKGYGFDFPLDTNETQEGRDRNRRVEFNILAVDGKPLTNQVIRKRAPGAR